uniref:ATP synthase F0 subunit 8 n=1 Tax=Epipenaeon fissurae TaxID=2995643 RepID=UPI0022FDA70F|nr:ATP synthase F0 subunit 8 [Epipenaeon fissurae]WBK03021.1 ATP synthase F0 subunit 8 [Epipenaeon fissurae]
MSPICWGCLAAIFSLLFLLALVCIVFMVEQAYYLETPASSLSDAYQSIHYFRPLF